MIISQWLTYRGAALLYFSSIYTNLYPQLQSRRSIMNIANSPRVKAGGDTISGKLSTGIITNAEPQKKLQNLAGGRMPSLKLTDSSESPRTFEDRSLWTLRCATSQKCQTFLDGFTQSEQNAESSARHRRRTSACRRDVVQIYTMLHHLGLTFQLDFAEDLLLLLQTMEPRGLVQYFIRS